MRQLLRLGIVVGAPPSGAAALFVWFAARGELAYAIPTLALAVPVLALWVFAFAALMRPGASALGLADILTCALGGLLFLGTAAILHGRAVYE